MDRVEISTMHEPSWHTLSNPSMLSCLPATGFFVVSRPSIWQSPLQQKNGRRSMDGEIIRVGALKVRMVLHRGADMHSTTPRKSLAGMCPTTRSKKVTIRTWAAAGFKLPKLITLMRWNHHQSHGSMISDANWKGRWNLLAMMGHLLLKPLVYSNPLKLGLIFPLLVPSERA